MSTCAVLRPVCHDAHQAAMFVKKASRLQGKPFSKWRFDRLIEKQLHRGVIFLGFTKNGKVLEDEKGTPIQCSEVRPGDIVMPAEEFAQMKFELVKKAAS